MDTKKPITKMTKITQLTEEDTPRKKTSPQIKKQVKGQSKPTNSKKIYKLPRSTFYDGDKTLSI